MTTFIIHNIANETDKEIYDIDPLTPDAEKVEAHDAVYLTVGFRPGLAGWTDVTNLFWIDELGDPHTKEIHHTKNCLYITCY